MLYILKIVGMNAGLLLLYNKKNYNFSRLPL